MFIFEITDRCHLIQRTKMEIFPHQFWGFAGQTLFKLCLPISNFLMLTLVSRKAIIFLKILFSEIIAWTKECSFFRVPKQNQNEMKRNPFFYIQRIPYICSPTPLKIKHILLQRIKKIKNIECVLWYNFCIEFSPIKNNEYKYCILLVNSLCFLSWTKLENLAHVKFLTCYYFLYNLYFVKFVKQIDAICLFFFTLS